MKRPTLLFLVTEDWYFCLHRLPIARAAREAGYDIIVATRVGKHRELMEREGFTVIPVPWKRRSLNPLRILLELWMVTRLYARLKPDLVHHVAIKPSILGSLANLLTRKGPVINNLAGLGHAFSTKTLLSRLLRTGLSLSFRTLFNRPRTTTIVENSDDRVFLIEEIGIRAQAVALIRGVGVDTTRFQPSPEPAGIPVVTMVTRMLWAKGVGDLVEAGRILEQRDIKVEILLVGVPDPDNPGSVPSEQLSAWDEEGLIKWLGHQDDIPAIWARSHLAVLPSYYREGIPRSLLEAASCGRALITTDTPGCREIVRPDLNGLLVPPRNPEALATAIERLLTNPQVRRQMGEASRKMVLEEFAERHVVEQTLNVYRRGRDE